MANVLTAIPSINLTDQISPDLSADINYNIGNKDTKLTIDYNINQDTKIEVSKDSEGGVNATLTVKF
jgi:hypothetical protein